MDGDVEKIWEVLGEWNLRPEYIPLYKKEKLFSKRKNERKRKQNQHCKMVSSPMNLESPGDQDTSLGMWLRMLPED